MTHCSLSAICHEAMLHERKLARTCGTGLPECLFRGRELPGPARSSKRRRCNHAQHLISVHRFPNVLSSASLRRAACAARTGFIGRVALPRFVRLSGPGRAVLPPLLSSRAGVSWPLRRGLRRQIGSCRGVGGAFRGVDQFAAEVAMVIGSAIRRWPGSTRHRAGRGSCWVRG